MNKPTFLNDNHHVFRCFQAIVQAGHFITLVPMDTLTHLTVGACVGEAFAGRQLGKRALLWGAFIHSLPDIDVVATLWLPTPAALLAHRGLTHSLFFCALIVPPLAFAAGRLVNGRSMSWTRWLLFFASLIILHDALDTFNNYGVGWLEPFSRARIAFNTLYVADPFFTIWPVIASVVLLFLGHDRPVRKKWRNLGLGISALYLGYCSVHKLFMDRTVRELLEVQKIRYTEYFTTPAPLQNWLWYVVAETDSGYYVGYRSVFDQKRALEVHYFPRNSNLLALVRDQDGVRRLQIFSQQFYTVERRRDTLLFNDLRFGQITGWQTPDAGFAFHYFLQYPAENKLVVQRGRFAGWNWQTPRSLYKRIRGN
jgi:inner membrane protein